MIVPGLQTQSFCLTNHVGDRVRLNDPGLGIGIVGRDAVGTTAVGVDVDPEQLAEQFGAVLCGVVGITTQAPVTDANVQVAIRAEVDGPTVVIDVGLIDGQ